MSGLDLAQQLITESKRSSATNTLTKYNDSLVRQLCREVRALDAHLVAYYDSITGLKLDKVGPETLCPPALVQSMVERDKRCLLAYHSHRIDQLKDFYWAKGGALPLILNDPDLRSKLGPHEVDFLREYSQMVGDWRSEVIDVVDLAMGVDRPPKDLNVSVVVTKECGVVSTESGEIDFQKGHRYLVRKSEVEHLILQGYLTEV
jgi:GINS complex subunit 1